MKNLLTEMERLVHRWKFYDEPPTRETLEEFLVTMGEVDESLHDECISDDQCDARVSEATCEFEEEIDKLKGELSDAKADISVYSERLKKGLVSARLAEDFIFTPEDARAQFRCVHGGAP